MATGEEAGLGPASSAPKRSRGKLIIYPLIIAVPALIIGGLIAFFSASEFTTPTLNESATGSIEMVVTGEHARPIGIGIDNFEDQISYEFLFPQEDVGQTYTLILSGSAQLSAVSGDLYGDHRHDYSNVPCGDMLLVQTSTECQVYIGTVPKSNNGQASFTYGCSELANPTSSSDYFGGYTGIDGTAEFDRASNWAYETVSYPTIETGTIGIGINIFAPGISLDPSLIPKGSHAPPITSCETMAGPPGFDDLVSAIPGTYGNSGNEEQWEKTDVTAVPFIEAIFRRSRAETYANIGIIFAGACFAITTGFLPLSFQAWLENPRRRKRAETERSPGDRRPGSPETPSGLGWPET